MPFPRVRAVSAPREGQRLPPRMESLWFRTPSARRRWLKQQERLERLSDLMRRLSIQRHRLMMEQIALTHPKPRISSDE